MTSYDCNNPKDECSDDDNNNITFYNPQNWNEEMDSFKKNLEKTDFNGTHCNYCMNKKKHIKQLLDNRKCLSDIDNLNNIKHNTNIVDNVYECMEWARDQDHKYKYLIYNENDTNNINKIDIKGFIKYTDGGENNFKLNNFQRLSKDKQLTFNDLIKNKSYNDKESYFNIDYQCSMNESEPIDKSKEYKLNEIENVINNLCLSEKKNNCHVADLDDSILLDSNNKSCKYQVYKNYTKPKPQSYFDKHDDNKKKIIDKKIDKTHNLSKKYLSIYNNMKSVFRNDNKEDFENDTDCKDTVMIEPSNIDWSGDFGTYNLQLKSKEDNCIIDNINKKLNEVNNEIKSLNNDKQVLQNQIKDMENKNITESNSTNTYLINKINTIKKNILNTKSNENFYMNVVKKLVWGFIIILSIAFIYFILVNLNIKRIKNSSNN